MTRIETTGTCRFARGRWRRRAAKRHRATLTVRMAAVRAVYPVVWQHLAAGTLGLDQVDELARVYANRRVREQFADVVEPFVVVASSNPTTPSSLGFASGAAGRRRRLPPCRAGRACGPSSRRHNGGRVHLPDGYGRLGAGVGAHRDPEPVRAGRVRRRGPTRRAFRRRRRRLVARADRGPTTGRRSHHDLRVLLVAASPDSIGLTPVVNIVVTQEMFEEQLSAVIEGRRPNWDTIESSRRWCTTTSGAPNPTPSMC